MQPRKSELSALVSLFYNDPAALGEMTPIAASEMPEAYRQMLAHQEHMTVAMEARHESIVDGVLFDDDGTSILSDATDHFIGLCFRCVAGPLNVLQ